MHRMWPRGLTRGRKVVWAIVMVAVVLEFTAVRDGGWREAWGATPEQTTKQSTGPSAANPLAPALVAQLEDEIRNGIKERAIQPQFDRFARYLGRKLDETGGPYSNSEVTGNCRLSWYDHMLRRPLQATAAAEKFTRELHQAMCGGLEGFDRALCIAREKMDQGRRTPRKFVHVKSPEEALEAVKQALVGAQTGYADALAPLTRYEISELNRGLYPILTSQNREGHTLVDRGTGRRLCNLLEKCNRVGFFDAADALLPLADPELLKQLAAIREEGDVKVDGVKGRVLRKIVTSAGTIVIGGHGDNVYELDKMMDVNVVIDLGGNDTYLEGTCSFERPVLVLIDLAGDDRYYGTKAGIQGGAVLGVSMLIDVAGNDTYQAQDVAQGSCLGGVGILIDMAGSDRYSGVRRVQGQALGGLGILFDYSGKDDYHAAMWAQGFGAPMGFGLLEDLEGDDHYYAGGLYRDSYPETPGYEGWSQGVGAGIRQVANGGIGVFLEGAGNDIYEYDYISHGGGYWCGMGFARDFSGNDQRLAGGTQKNFQGGPREQTPYQRFSCGFGCHYALGFCFDDSGNDTYGGTIMGLGFAWDASVGALCDFGGNDRYEATGGHTEGNGAQAGLGILFDYTGDDVYLGYSQGYASPSISYHTLPECGGNFSYVIDYGGKDTYGCGAANNSYNRRGAEGGFLIDRPLPSEVTDEKTTEGAKKDSPVAEKTTRPITTTGGGKLP